MTMGFEALYEKAKAVLNPRRLSESAEAGGVGAALLTESGAVCTGVCIDTGSSMGFCAERVASRLWVSAGTATPALGPWGSARSSSRSGHRYR